MARPGDLGKVVKTIENALQAVRRNHCPRASDTVRPWKNVDTTVGFHKDLLALTAGLEGLGEARTAAVARSADDSVTVAPRTMIVDTRLRGDLPERRRTELTAVLKALTEYQELADDAVAAVDQTTTAEQGRAVKMPVVGWLSRRPRNSSRSAIGHESSTDMARWVK